MMPGGVYQLKCLRLLWQGYFYERYTEELIWKDIYVVDKGDGKGNEWSVVTLAEHIRPGWWMLEPAWSLQTVFYISWYVAADYIALIFFWNDDCIVAGWFLLSRLVATATGSTQAKCSHTVACWSAWAPARYFDPWWREKLATPNVHGIPSSIIICTSCCWHLWFRNLVDLARERKIERQEQVEVLLWPAGLDVYYGR